MTARKNRIKPSKNKMTFAQFKAKYSSYQTGHFRHPDTNAKVRVARSGANIQYEGRSWFEIHRKIQRDYALASNNTDNSESTTEVEVDETV